LNNILKCLQSGKKTNRASGSSSEPKNISCTICLLQRRHCRGHGSPQIPMPILRKDFVKEDENFEIYIFTIMATW
jgi:hypothetical protein